MSAQLNNGRIQPTEPAKRFTAVGSPIKPRCYITEDEQIDAVCHHCGRPISFSEKQFPIDSIYRRQLIRKHKATKPSKGWRKRLNQLSGAFYLRFPEYTELPLERDTAVHCETCTHLPGLNLIVNLLLWLSLLLLIWRVLLTDLPFARAVWLPTILAFTVLFTLGLVNFIYFQYKLMKSPPPFPLIGRAPSVQISEFLHSSITVNGDGEYTAVTDLNRCHGTITTNAQMTRLDKSRLEKYRQKYRRKNLPRIPYSLGFLLFDNIRPVKFHNETQYLFKNKLKPLRLRSSNPLGKWETNGELPAEAVEQHYDLPFAPDEDREVSPLQIFAAIISEGTNYIENKTDDEQVIQNQSQPRTGLELIVQVNPKIWAKNLLATNVTIKELCIEVDSAKQFGSMPLAKPIQSLESKENVVVWKGIKLESPDEKLLYENLSSETGQEIEAKKTIARKRFFVRFREQNFTPDTKLRGRLVAKFDDTISGIGNVQFFDPLGYKVDKRQFRAKGESTVTINFSIDLAYLKIREHVAPKVASLGEYDKIPDHHLVNKVVAKLISDEKTYVQRVVENPPQTNQASGLTENRFWDIGGRQYEGVYPMNFHIMLSGRQHYEGSDLPNSGESTFNVEISATSSCEETVEAVEVMRDRLVGIIESSVKKSG